MRAERSRTISFALLVSIAIAVSALSIAAALGRTERSRLLPGTASASRIPDADTLAYLSTADGVYRVLGWTSLEAPRATGNLSRLECQRVHFAGGWGLCAGTGYGGSGLVIFDQDLQVTHVLHPEGIASRARVSADGRYGATTFFVSGDSYADVGFSTRTTIYAMRTGDVVGQLEDFATYRDGALIRSIDFNFWGVTFAQDSNRFYATLGTGGMTFLVAGDIAKREMRVLRPNAECPSLSPDGKLIAFKKRMPGESPLTVTWRLYVLDLATMQERPLAETRSVDDQVEWLDDAHVTYFLTDAGPPATIRPDLWAAGVDGGAPTLLRTGAISAVVIR